MKESNIAMRRKLFAIALTLAVLTAHAGENTGFAGRVALANKFLAQEKTAAYVRDEMIPAIRPALYTAMRACRNYPGASSENFAVVADVTREGEFVDIDYEPKTNTGACMTRAMVSFRAPPPACDCAVLPIHLYITPSPVTDKD
jgi:hypothetical protein